MVNSKFKELLVAALLFECGDYQNQGQEILEAYTKDVNGHFAAYAHHIRVLSPHSRLCNQPKQTGGSSGSSHLTKRKGRLDR